MYANDLFSLKASPLHELKTMVDEAAAKGRDLVVEMVDHLKRDILVAGMACAYALRNASWK